ncbi:MAG: UvrD-helicase domain-containing protein [Clostridia bacterium]|nr:UvrD-helicase domain-containing protein [Clostridia bacterium]
MYLDNLNEKQREAATYITGPLLILAGAGSGKTSTMTHRIAYLVNQGISPYEILAVTFTNKAAGEMRDRVEALIGPAPGMWVITFHSMCLRMLRSHADLLGYESNFVVYDSQDQKTVVKNILKEMKVEDKKLTPAYFLAAISKNKEKAILPDKVWGEDPLTKMVRKVYTQYDKTLRKNNAMDFDDLLLNAYFLLKKNPDVLAKYQDRFKYIMVDEYQDTNHIQYELVKMLAENHRNICVVGDDDQCIYEWRGADIRNILDFEKDFKEAKVVKLEQNYRSTSNIIEAAHSVIKNNKGRKSKKLWTEKEAGQKISYQVLDNEKEEARYIANQIDTLVRGGKKYNDFAILYRVNAQSQALEKGLALMDIPYRVLAGLRFYDRKEVKDALAYMRLVTNPKDDLSLERVINVPKRGIGSTTVAKLKTLAMVEEISLFETLDQVEKAADFAELITSLQKEKDNLKVSDVYDIILKKSGYMQSLIDENTVEAQSRIENLLEFKSVIYDYEKENPEITIDEFMESVSLIAEVDNHDPSEDAVTLMTLHSAKGLEFPVVFMPGMEFGLFPGVRAFEDVDGIEEERRLCYVGMTRAKERLFMSGARMRMLYGRTDFTRPSNFMEEIDPHFLEGDSVFRPKPTNRIGIDTGSMDGYSASPFKPFDPLRYAKKEVEEVKDEINEGDMVTHSKFGKGVVLSNNGKIMEVDFEKVGVKKLAVGFAPLKKI